MTAHVESLAHGAEHDGHDTGAPHSTLWAT